MTSLVGGWVPYQATLADPVVPVGCGPKRPLQSRAARSSGYPPSDAPRVEDDVKGDMTMLGCGRLESHFDNRQCSVAPAISPGKHLGCLLRVGRLRRESRLSPR